MIELNVNGTDSIQMYTVLIVVLYIFYKLSQTPHTEQKYVCHCKYSILKCMNLLALFFIYSGNSNERQFLKDFVGAVPGSSGERLACWLQPDRRLDPNKCELKPIGEPVRYGWPTHLTVITRDQYGDQVYVPNLKVTNK